VLLGLPPTYIKNIIATSEAGTSDDIDTVLNPAVRAVTELNSAVSQASPAPIGFGSSSQNSSVPPASNTPLTSKTNFVCVVTRTRTTCRRWIVRDRRFTATSPRFFITGNPIPPRVISSMIVTRNGACRCTRASARPTGSVENPALQKADTE